jgi:hypothetical protein
LVNSVMPTITTSLASWLSSTVGGSKPGGAHDMELYRGMDVQTLEARYNLRELRGDDFDEPLARIREACCCDILCAPTHFPSTRNRARVRHG